MSDVERPAGIDAKDISEFQALTPAQIRQRCFNELENATDPDDILLLKRGILQLTAYLNPDDIEGLFGIGIVARNEGELEGAACTDYTIGKGIDVEAFHDNMFKNYKAGIVPTTGAYALYSFLGILKHIGRVTDRGTVISKWGPNGHVYEHDPKMVPLQYGDSITYYLPPGRQ